MGEYKRRTIVTSTEWMDKAECSKHPQIVFHIPDGNLVKGNKVVQLYARAKLICKVCPVIEDCLNFALENKMREGVWGGKSPVERERIEYRRRRGYD